MRQQIQLDGVWQFQIDRSNSLTLDQITQWRSIRVPGPWQAQFDDLRLASGVGWYRREMLLPPAWEGHSIFLCFGAVDYFTEGWLNGVPIGQHEGGYTPFEFEITHAARLDQQNELVLRVVDPGPKEGDIFPEFPFLEIPHGKQSWYGPVGGIWQPVFMEARPASFIRQIHATPQGLDGRVEVVVELAGQGQVDTLAINCVSPQGEQAASAAVGLVTDHQKVRVQLSIPAPKLWHPDSPNLYTLDVALGQAGRVLDQQQVRFGIRTFEARDGRLWLNGLPFYLRGALDQDYYPEGIYTPPSQDFLREQVRLAKAMGLNCLRCHIKVPDPRYLQAADEEGLLIWAEIPSWGKLSDKSWCITEAAGRRARDTFAAMVARDWNHPSVVIWSLVNEDWGTNLPHSAADRRWLAETFDWARSIAGNRLIVDNSACNPNFHVKTDLDDFHFYAAMPDSLEKWHRFVTEFAARPAWSFSPHGDATRTGREPLIVSEFGNWGLPDIECLKAAYGGSEPWWFITGGEWGSPSVVLPAGAESRLETAGLNAVFENWSALARAAQEAQHRALKHEIEFMRAFPSITGYVITEWSDLHWECNGLVDMARNPRVFKDLMHEFNADTIIVPRWERLACWSGEAVRMDLVVSHYGPQRLENTQVVWSLEGSDLSGAVPIGSLAPGEVSGAVPLAFTAPGTDTPRSVTLTLRLSLQDNVGHIICQNTQMLSLIPIAQQQITDPIPVWCEDTATSEALQARGCVLNRNQGLHIVTRLDADTVEYVRSGGRALLAASEAGPLALLDGAAVVDRAGTPWAGDWASSFGWRRPGFSSLPGGPLWDFTWLGALPARVITGIQVGDVLAGLFVGWVHLPVATAARIPVGRGMLTVTTFDVLPVNDSPARTVLLHDLIRAALAPVSSQ